VQDTRSYPSWKVAPGCEDWNKVNCASCETWRRDKGKCRNINGVMLSIDDGYEESIAFAAFDNMMKGNRGVYLDER